MKELKKIFNGAELTVSEKNGNMYFDVSGVANKYNKRISRYEETEEFKEYLKVCNIARSEAILKVGNTVEIHKDIFVSFARWINIKFAVWADKLIYSIITGEVKILNNKLLVKDEQIKRLSSSLYAKPRGSGSETVTRIIRDYSIEMTPHELNIFLCGEGILSTEDRVVEHFVSNTMHNDIALVHVDTVLALLDKYGVARGLGYADNRPTLF